MIASTAVIGSQHPGSKTALSFHVIPRRLRDTLPMVSQALTITLPQRVGQGGLGGSNRGGSSRRGLLEQFEDGFAGRFDQRWPRCQVIAQLVHGPVEQMNLQQGLKFLVPGGQEW